MSEPTFFRGRRLSVYCKGGRLAKDKKTDLRFWRLKLALTLTAADAHACGGAIESNFQQIQARENSIGKIEMDDFTRMVVMFFPTEDATAPQLLRLGLCLLDDFAMTHADGMTELWVQCEHENTDALHRFVKDYAFTRFYVEFLPAQRSFVESIAEGAAESLQNRADETGVRTTLLDGSGKTVADFKPKGRPN